MSKTLHAPLARFRSSRQRGVTLIEALVALLVMSFGMLALVGLMGNLRLGADVAKQRSEAMRIAREDLAQMRDYSALDDGGAPVAGTTYYNQNVKSDPQPVLITPDDSNTTYEKQRFVTDVDGVQAKQVRVVVRWTDRSNGNQFVNLDTVIAGIDPVFSAAVGFTPRYGAVAQPSGRSPVIPAGAKQVDPNLSAFRPSALGSTVWVFNNLTGVITGVCSIPAGTPVSSLTLADVDSCKNNTVGYLLSGTVRFSNTNPPNPSLPEANAIPVHIDIVDGTYQLPRFDAQGAVVKDSSGNVVLDSFAATKPNKDCFDESPTTTPVTQTFVNYNCIVYPDNGTPRSWSGKVVLTGLTLGTTAAEYRVCRYSADYNGNGSPFVANMKGLDNGEHPAVYGVVTGSLARQNFLVIRGDLTCPSAPPVNTSAGVFVNYSTIQLQP